MCFEFGTFFLLMIDNPKSQNMKYNYPCKKQYCNNNCRCTIQNRSCHFVVGFIILSIATNNNDSIKKAIVNIPLCNITLLYPSLVTSIKG